MFSVYKSYTLAFYKKQTHAAVSPPVLEVVDGYYTSAQSQREHSTVRLNYQLYSNRTTEEAAEKDRGLRGVCMQHVLIKLFKFNQL